MRRKHLTVFGLIPMARALSLGNFQGITSDSIPLSCQLAYAATIPTCTVTDFNNSGCTAGCVSGLESVASNVQSACDGVEVSSVTLLGIIMNGGIIQALCPILAETTQQPPQATIVTIPTDSRGVTGGLGFKTTSTTQEHQTTQPQTTQQSHTTQQPPKQTTILTTTSSRSISTSTSESTTSTISDDTFLTTIFPTTTTQSANGGAAVATTSTSSKSSSATKAASTPKPDKGSGGGSPFDISSNGGPNRLQGSYFGAAIALMVCTLILR